MTGLAVVLVLILLASALVGFARNDAPVSAIGAANADTVANMTGIGNAAAPEVGGGEPLAELGIAPAAGNTTASAPAAEPGRP